MIERLTNRTEGGIAYTKIPANPSNMIDVGECYTGRVIDRLAAYEDTGLTPERIRELQNAFNILFESERQKQQENEQLREFANTKAEGWLVKRGKWIYEHEWKCSSCGWAQSHDFNTVPNDILKYCPNCGAKMSKEEAEKALDGIDGE